MIRKMVASTIGLLLVLGLLALPPAAGAQAAPAITVTPTSGPPGTAFAITGTGFTPNSTVVIVLETTGAVGNRTPEPEETIRVGTDGRFRHADTRLTNAPASAVPAQYDFVILASPTRAELARATVTLTSPRGEALAVSPTSGAAGTRFVVTGGGFTAGETLLYRVLDPQQRSVVPTGQLQVGADGRFQVAIDSSGFAPAGYAVLIATPTPAGTRILGAVGFTVAAAGSPSLPRTGAGGLAGPASAPPSPLAGLGVVTLAGLAGGVALRRRLA